MAEEITDNETKDAADSVEEAVHAEAMERFDSVIVAVQEERALALQDRRFVTIDGAQWEADGWDGYTENSVRVQIDKTSQGVEKIEGDYRANRMIVNFRAVDNGASKETADTLDGMFRADYYVSNGKEATDNAFMEAVQGGMGAWRLRNVDYDPYDPDDERQRVAFEVIGDADQSVFFDGNAKRMVKSDAEWCFVITAMSKLAFQKEYGSECVTEFPQGLIKPAYDWYTPDVIRVAEYYAVEVKAEKRYTLESRATGETMKAWASDMDDSQLADLQTEGWRLLRSRQVKRRRVKKYILSGSEILKPGVYIAGTEIPIIPVYGKRSYVDNQERTRGHVRKAKDPQRVYNMQISKLTETAATAPQERPIFTPGQMQGHETSWAEANLNRAPYALVNPLIDPVSGQMIQTGPIGSVQPPQLSPVLGALIQITASDITEITASDDGAAMTQSNVSAEAMDIAAERTDAKSRLYMDNMEQSMGWCGKVWLGMTRDIVEEGQEVELADAADKPMLSTAVIAEPFTDEKGRFSIRNDIASGKYNVMADVTEATATRRDKTVKTCMNMAQILAPTSPDVAEAYAITAGLNMDGEGTDDLQAWLRQKALGMGLVKPTPEEQQEIEQAAQQQQPDPQADFLAATAEKARADAQKALAGVKQTEADTVLKLAQAHKTREDAKNGGDQHKMGMVERVKGFFQPKAKEPGNAARGMQQ
jgi:hypothetical protein